MYHYRTKTTVLTIATLLTIASYPINTLCFITSVGCSLLLYLYLRQWRRSPRKYLPLYDDEEVDLKGGCVRGEVGEECRGRIAQGFVPALLGISLEEGVGVVCGVCECAGDGLGVLESDSIVHVFTSCVNQNDLHWLKKTIDAELRCSQVAECKSLYELVYSLLSKSHRDVLLSHFDGVYEQGKTNGEELCEQVILMSDIDDTLVSTLKDWRYPFQTLYPGVKQFYHELIVANMRRPISHSIEATNKNINEQDSKQNIIFVTARPPFLDTFTYGSLKAQG